MESSRSIGPRGEIMSPSAHLKRSPRSSNTRVPKRGVLETPHRNDTCHLAVPGRTGPPLPRVLAVDRLLSEDRQREPKRSKKESSLILGFSDEDKKGTIQPHDDALVVTLRIGGFDVKGC